MRQNIRRHYPLLQSDCEKGGMASFVEEVGMNVGIGRDDIESEESSSSPQMTIFIGQSLAEARAETEEGETVELMMTGTDTSS